MELTEQYMTDRIRLLQQEYRQSDEHSKLVLGALKEAENNLKLLRVKVELKETKGAEDGANPQN